jgi:hypothetical protein
VRSALPVTAMALPCSVPIATARTALVWWVRTWPIGVPFVKSHTRTVSSAQGRRHWDKAFETMVRGLSAPHP